MGCKQGYDKDRPHVGFVFEGEVKGTPTRELYIIDDPYFLDYITSQIKNKIRDTPERLPNFVATSFEDLEHIILLLRAKNPAVLKQEPIQLGLEGRAYLLTASRSSKPKKTRNGYTLFYLQDPAKVDKEPIS